MRQCKNLCERSSPGTPEKYLDPDSMPSLRLLSLVHQWTSKARYQVGAMAVSNVSKAVPGAHGRSRRTDPQNRGTADEQCTLRRVSKPRPFFAAP